MLGENGAEVPLADPGHACRAGECRLLWTDVYAFRVKAVRLKQPDEFAASAANVDDGTGHGRRKQGTDVTPVNKSSRLAAAAASVLRGVGLVETVPRVGQASCSHNQILLGYSL